jgi:hypothetical protein
MYWMTRRSPILISTEEIMPGVMVVLLPSTSTQSDFSLMPYAQTRPCFSSATASREILTISASTVP